MHGTDVVMRAAARHGKRLLFASTSEVYGKNSDGALHEESDRILGSAFKSRWSYAIAKSYGEALVYGYHREHGADASVVRLFNTIGPRQRGAYGMVVPRLVRQAIAGDDVTVYGDGTQSRCFLHVHDAVDGHHRRRRPPACHRPGVQHRQPAPITILELAQRIIERADSTRGSASSPTTRPTTRASRSWAAAAPIRPRSSSSSTGAPTHPGRRPRRRDRLPARGAGGRNRTPPSTDGGHMTGRASSSPAAPASSARTWPARCSSAATRSACSTTSPPAGARTSRLGDEIELVEGDIQSYERANKAVAGCEVVFHQAALPSVPRSVQDPLTSNATNVIGTLNVLLAARDHGVRRVVCASSSSVYGSGARDGAQARGPARRPDLALRDRQARRRGLRAQLPRRVRPGDGRASLLQRVRPAPGPDLPVRRGHPELHHRAARRPAAGDLRRRRAVARLHLRRERRRGEPARDGRARASRARSTTSPAASA